MISSAISDDSLLSLTLKTKGLSVALWGAVQCGGNNMVGTFDKQTNK